MGFYTPNIVFWDFGIRNFLSVGSQNSKNPKLFRHTLEFVEPKIPNNLGHFRFLKNPKNIFIILFTLVKEKNLMKSQIILETLNNFREKPPLHSFRSP